MRNEFVTTARNESRTMAYLENHRVTFEPIERWPGEETRNRTHSPFRSRFTETLDLLDRELHKLSARNVVIQVDLPRSKIRQDGAPRADARLSTPRVILSFRSRGNPMQFPCDKFNDWHDNVRAIALALEALRKVDRYGVTQRGEQYRGWQTLPAPAVEGFRSREAAWQFIAKLIGVSGPVPPRYDLPAHLRVAQQKTHPDTGGDPDQFKRVMQAEKRLLAS